MDRARFPRTRSLPSRNARTPEVRSATMSASASGSTLTSESRSSEPPSASVARLSQGVQPLEVLGEALVDDLARALARPRQHHGELVAADSRLHVGVAERIAQQLPGLGEDTVARGAAEPLVDGVEAVDVEDE